MFSSWATIIVGWPAVIAAALIVLIAFVIDRPWLLLVGAIVGTPFGLYLLGSPVLWPAAAVSLLTLYSAPVALRHRRVVLAAGLVAPFFGLASFVAFRAWQAALPRVPPNSALHRTLNRAALAPSALLFSVRFNAGER